MALRFIILAVLAAGCADDDLGPTKGPREPPRYTVGGTLQGLSGQLVLLNNGADALELSADGAFSFSEGLPSRAIYDVSLASSPEAQDCRVMNGRGIIGEDDVHTVYVVCSTRAYTLGGEVSGLSGVLGLANGDELLLVGREGPFSFPRPIADLSSYDVVVASQPRGEVCSVTGGTGIIMGADALGVAVSCVTLTFLLGGSASGVTEPVLLHDGLESLELTSDGDFTFVTPLSYGTAYLIEVEAPASLACTLSGAAGVMDAADSFDVGLSCEPLFRVAGSVTGLSGSLALAFGDELLELSGDGPFAFTTRLLDGTAFEVSIAGQPASQACSLTGGSGAIGGSDAVLAVSCVDAHGVHGSVTGLASGILALTLGQEVIELDGDGAFEFSALVAEGEPYLVEVGRHPAGRLCEIDGAAGDMGEADVAVSVECRVALLALEEIHVSPASGAFGDANGDGIRSSDDDEFIEISNQDTLAVDLEGFRLRSGSSSIATRFTFPPGAVLLPGARAVVFGGGTPQGGFGPAHVFAAGSLQLTNGGASVLLDAGGDGGLELASYTYSAADLPCPGGTCASIARDGAAWVPHTTAAGDVGILWSPGVAATEAVLKVVPAMSSPLAGSQTVSVGADVRLQLNMHVDADTMPAVQLLTGPCDTTGSPVLLASRGPGQNAGQVHLVPEPALAYASPYCVVAGVGLSSSITVPLLAEVRLDFQTRPAGSATASSVVLSEYGAADFSGHDEFVELFNPTAAPVDISGWSIQRRTASGGTSCWVVLPVGQSIAARGYYLIGGASYDAASYGGVEADWVGSGTTITGGNESLVLVGDDSCSIAGPVVDSVSTGVITDAAAALSLPAFPVTLTDGEALERKACYDSTADDDAGHGMLGGHLSRGNGERIGASSSDWLLRAAPEPQPDSQTELDECEL